MKVLMRGEMSTWREEGEAPQENKSPLRRKNSSQAYGVTGQRNLRVASDTAQD